MALKPPSTISYDPVTNTLSWSGASGNIASYNIYKANNSAWSLLTTVTTTVTSGSLVLDSYLTESADLMIRTIETDGTMSSDSQIRHITIETSLVGSTYSIAGFIVNLVFDTLRLKRSSLTYVFDTVRKTKNIVNILADTKRQILNLTIMTISADTLRKVIKTVNVSSDTSRKLSKFMTFLFDTNRVMGLPRTLQQVYVAIIENKKVINAKITLHKVYNTVLKGWWKSE